MKRTTLAIIGLLLVACGGPASGGPTGGQPTGGGTPAPAPASATDGGNASGGVRIHLVLGGGPHEGTYDLPHSNPCHKNRPNDGEWALTTTYPGASSGPTIVDFLFGQDSSYVDAWFGDDQFRAADVDFNIDDRGTTATLTATGEATGPGGEGASFPVEITIECDRVADFAG